MGYVDKVKQYLSDGKEKDKKMDLGECFGQLVKFENILKDFRERNRIYGRLYAEITRGEHEDLEYLIEYFSLEDGRSALRKTTHDANGNIIYFEAASFNINGGEYIYDEYDACGDKKFKHYEAEVINYPGVKEPYVKSNTTQSVFTNTSEYLAKGFALTNEIERDVAAIGGLDVYQEGDFNIL